MITLAALVALAPHAGELPTRIDVDFARVGFIHACVGDGMVHCNRIRNLRCAFANRKHTLARCRYDEWAPGPVWPRKAVQLSWSGDTWHWVEGDPPRCSVTVFTDE